jgi:hypothetical protein
MEIDLLLEEVVSTSDGDFNILEKRKWKASQRFAFFALF